MTWTTAYEECFDSDSEDKPYYEGILAVPIAPLRKHLEDTLAVINGTLMPMEAFAKFKFTLLRSEKEWGEEVFDWCITDSSSFQIRIRWETLNADPRRYFLVAMSLEDCWGLKFEAAPTLPNIWPILGQYIN